MFDWHVPLSDLDFGPEEDAAALRVLHSRWLSMGPEVQAFEREFADFVGAKHAVAVTNGTAAIHLAFLALGLGSGDEIIQPAINFVAGANMTVALGAVPVFADIISLCEPTLDPGKITPLITARTKAVMVMHYAGYPCRMADICEICRQHGLALIEDACHSIGARYLDPQERIPHNRMTGTLGDVAGYSFFSNKNLATGEGGMVVTDRDDLAAAVRLNRSHGMTTLTWDRHQGHASSYDVVSNGYNYRFDELRAAIGRAQLRKLAQNNRVRRELVMAYRRRLSDLVGWTIPFGDYQGDSAYHLMVVVAPDEPARARVVQDLRNARIQTSLHYPLIADFDAFNSKSAAGVQTARAFSKRAITLPLFSTMSEAQVDAICAVIRNAAGR